MKLPAPLRFLTDALAPIDSGREQAAAALLQGGIDWPTVFHYAGNHWVTPSLAGSLRRHGLFERIPEEMAEYLDTIQTLNRERNQMLYRELVEVARRLNQIGVEPLLLKGAIALMPNQYPGAEDRVMGDLDILVPTERLESAYQALLRGGYECREETPRLDARTPWTFHHGPPLYHLKQPVRIEPHLRLLGDVACSARLWENLVEIPLTLAEGVQVRIPDPDSRLLHNFLHTQIQDKHQATFSVYLRPLLEFVQLRAHLADGWNPSTARSRLEPRHRVAFDRYLLLAEQFFHQPAPAELERSWRQRLAIATVVYTLPRPRWQRVLKLLPRLGNLPRRLMTPSWYPRKLRELRRGVPL